ncbi:hypothetical protein UFOVP1261_5 [uncultured Caudovirales phage]|uniref:Uncharacterized protein n=1 Tax=uncultured Caudovirales phage TaxID=2100421 RepID=A0A6J5RAN5_9CAUD|nr:hypothetical protein UFOVP1261_5 [uncultured Caudovirales phage]CAB4221967.1 hypothetical protein UFOVP1650_19 [uncultured Caudovirales phage]
MKLEINIVYNNGETATYIAGLPEWSKWERKTGKSFYAATKEKIAAEGIGSIYQQQDFLFLAHCAYIRAAAGKPTKPYEIWENTIDEMTVEPATDPKVSPSEVSTE